MLVLLITPPLALSPLQMSSLAAFTDARAADLAAAVAAARAAVTGAPPPPLPPHALHTAGVALALANVAALCVSRRGRAAVVATADTAAASALLIALLVVVLGLPVGAAYLGTKGAAYVWGGVRPWLVARLG